VGRGEHIDTASTAQLAGAFTTVFFIFGLGFAIQRLRPLGDDTHHQLSKLVVMVVLPIYTFYATATNATPEALGRAPTLIWMGVLVASVNFVLATLVFRPAGIAPEQQRVFRFANLLPNTAFIGYPICLALFGPLGLFYAAVHDFGSALVVWTLGIWDLSGGRLANWRSLLLSPLIWSIAAGVLWALVGLPMPQWAGAPLQTLGNATVPLALLVGGMQLGGGTIQVNSWTRQLLSLSALRLIISPLVIALIVLAFGWHDVVAKVIVIQNALPAGITLSMMARAYGSDARFGAVATLWSTIGSLATLPAAAFVVMNWF
jgi:predicted permease